MPDPRQIVSLGAFYLCIFGALGALFPFLPILLDRRGLLPGEIAWVMSLIPVANLLAPPLWGVLADLRQARVLLLRVAAVGAAVSLALFIPRGGLLLTLAAMAAHCFFRAPLAPLADAITHATLGARGSRYSRVRVWGSLGFATAVATVGSLAPTDRPLLLFGVPAAVLLCATVATLGIHATPANGGRPRITQAVGHLRHGATLLFLLATSCYYAAHAVFDVFFGIYMRRLGHDDAFVGLAWAIGVAVEVVVMLTAPRLVAHSAKLLPLCAVAAAARWLLIARSEAAATLLAIQTLHGVTFGLWFVCFVREIQARAPENLRAAHQSLGMAAMGLGQVAGFHGGGQLFARRGGNALFAGAAVASGVAGALYALLARRGGGPAVAREELSATPRR